MKTSLTSSSSARRACRGRVAAWSATAGLLLAIAAVVPLLAGETPDAGGAPPAFELPPPSVPAELSGPPGAPPPGPPLPFAGEAQPGWPSPSRMLDDLREIRPDLVERLLNLHEQDPDTFRTEVRRLLSTWRVLSVLEQQNPERYRELIALWKANDPKFDEELRRESTQMRIPRPRWPFPGPPEQGMPPGEPGFAERGDPGDPGRRGPERRGSRPPWHSSPAGQLELQIRDLQQQWHAAADAELRSKLRGQLRDAIARMADLRAKYYADRIAYLEKELQRLKELVERRETTREEIIDTQLEELLATPPPPPDAGQHLEAPSFRP